MSEIAFNCPGCNQLLEAPAEMAGETVECPTCSQQMVVPEPPREELSLGDIAIGGTAPPPISAADVIARAAAAEAAAEPDAATEPTHEAPVCPECGAAMDPEAVLCMTCGYHKTLGRKISTTLE